MQKTQATFLLLIIGCAAFFADGLYNGTPGIYWPDLRDGLNRDNGDFGVLLFAFAIGNTSIGLFNGPLIKRWDYAPLFMAAFTLMGAGALGIMLAPNWLLVLAATMMVGTGNGMVQSVLNSFVALRFRPKRISWLHASFSLGSFSGTLLTTATLTTIYGWRSALAITAVIMLLLTATFYVTRNRWMIPNSAVENEQATDVPTASAAATLRLPTAWLFIILAFVMIGVEVTVASWSFTFLTESRNIALADAGFWAGLYWGMLTIGRILSGFFDIAPIKLLRGGSLLLLSGILIWWLVPLTSANPIGLALIGFGSATLFPAQMGLLPRRMSAAHTPNTVGFELAGGALGAAMLPAIFGWLSTTIALNLLPFYLFACALIMAVIIQLLNKDRHEKI